MNINEKLNPLSADPTKWSNTLKLFVGNLQFEHFVGLGLKVLTYVNIKYMRFCFYQ